MGASQSGPSGPLTVGLDIGTTACKALLVDDRGVVVARARFASGLRTGGGVFEHDALSTWRELPRQALSQVTAGYAGQVAGVAICAPVPSLAPVGAGGVPIGPGLLYGDDRGQGDDGRNVPGAKDRAPGGDDPTASEEMLHMAAWAARLYPQAEGYWPAQAVANASLCGEGVLDLASAFGAGPLYNGSGWDDEACAAAGIPPSKLPRVAVFGEAVGFVASENLRGTAVGGGASRPGPVLGAGSVDGLCEQIVSGACEDGDLLVTLGSTMVVWLCVPGWPEVAPGLWRVPHVVGGKAFVGGASTAGGLWLDWVEGLLGPAPEPDPGPRSDGSRAHGALRPAEVPIWWPWARGERVPAHDRSLRIGLAGADVSHGPAALRRAAYEASAFVVRRIAELAAHSGTPVKRALVAGGGSARAQWAQAIADTMSLPVLSFDVPESAALGAAFLARMACQPGTPLEEAATWAQWRPPVQPDPRWSGAADERYQRWLAGC